jgi:hypothetical protein
MKEVLCVTLCRLLRDTWFFLEVNIEFTLLRHGLLVTLISVCLVACCFVFCKVSSITVLVLLQSCDDDVVIDLLLFFL